jgi:hypothetical protein
MTILWPWMVVAALGALHGLNPANGWMFAAAWGMQARDESLTRRVLPSIAIGHAVSISVVVGIFAQGMSMNRALVQATAGALLLGAAVYRMLRRTGQRMSINMRLGYAGMALWSFLMATAHGAGLMLLPALIPLCLANSPARELTASGSLVLALVAVGVHMAAMLITTGVIATGVCRGVAMHPRLLNGSVLSHAWTAALAFTGIMVMVIQ